jgi:NAD+ synthase
VARAESIARWIRQQVAAAGARGLVVGLSGGLDSAVVARLAQLAAPSAVVAALLPCHSDPIDEADAAAVAAHFSLTIVRIDLSSAYDELTAGSQAALKALPASMRQPPASFDRRPIANIKPRLRMTALYFLANSLNYLVAGTSNRAAIAAGHFTKYGDGGVDIQPIGRLLKREVRSMARDLGVPPPILARVPGAGLWIGQTDEEELGFSYDELDRYLDEGPESVAPATALKIERLIRSAEHKAQLPPMPEE